MRILYSKYLDPLNQGQNMFFKMYDWFKSFKEFDIVF